MSPKHSIYIITYNQEDLIGRAIDSLLIQKDFVYEIVVSDDCSTDDTWSVIQGYQKKYPELVRPFRNLKNLGIFGNIESCWSKVTGDVIYPLSGDDILCNGLFEEANKLIIDNDIDIKKDYFTLYFDWKSIDPDGNEKIGTNHLIKNHNPVSLKIRNLIQNRTTGIGKKVLEQFSPIRKDIGIYADILIDVQTMQFSKRSLYSPFIGSVYFNGSGTASSTSYLEKMNSVSLVFKELQKKLKGLPKSDINWIKYRKFKSIFIVKPNVKIFLLYFMYLMRVLDFKYGKDFVMKEIRAFFSLSCKALTGRTPK